MHIGFIDYVVMHMDCFIVRHLKKILALQSYLVLLLVTVIFVSGNVQEDEVVDSNVLPYCSLDQNKKKTIGEMEQEFLQALQVIIRIPRFLSLMVLFIFYEHMPLHPFLSIPVIL